VIPHNIGCEGRGYQDVYWKLVKNGGWKVKGKGREMEGVERNKVKYTHSGHL
jgi:hypothetical protein